jgi:Protein of unknown function (DUF1569)
VTERRKLHFANTEAVAADVGKLRAGYRQLGSWSLPQTCWHLKKALDFSMRAGPYDPMRGGLGKWILMRGILLVGRLPTGVYAPERITPAKDVPESAIDEFLTTLETLKNHKGEFAPHPRLGTLSRRSFYKLHLIHCAHHLGFLIPTNGLANGRQA